MQSSISSEPKAAPGRQKPLYYLIPLLLAVGFIFFVWLLFPYQNRIQFDGDEGINLLKAMMVREGYPLYDQIWSDQPPLLTYLLVGLFQVFPMEVNPARFFILVLSAVLLVGVFLFMRQVWGGLHALIGVLLILLLPYYLELSVSVMVGLPAIAFAMLALAPLPAWHRQRKRRWLVLSALAMSASVLIKLFTGFLVPIIGLGLIVGELAFYGRNWKHIRVLYPAFLWSLVFIIPTGAILLVSVSPGNLSQLFGSHLEARAMIQSSLYTINFFLRDSMPLLLLAGLGILVTLVSRRWLGLYLAAWLGSAYGLLLFHSPVWYHHQLLVTIPAALLGAAAVGEAIHALRKAFLERRFFSLHAVLGLAVLLSCALLLVGRVPNTLNGLQIGANTTRQPLQDRDLVLNMYRKVGQYAADTHWMVTTMPMLAFRYKIAVPPNLVVFSTKRFETGNLSDAEVLRNLLAYHPEQVLMPVELPELKAYLEENYDLVLRRGDVDLYIRLDIAGKQVPED
jgi:hypothetical protein